MEGTMKRGADLNEEGSSDPPAYLRTPADCEVLGKQRGTTLNRSMETVAERRVIFRKAHVQHPNGCYCLLKR